MVIFWLFGICGLMAIAGGGVIIAFTAKRPNRLVAWASAYLVLIVGLLQVGIGASLHYLLNNPAIWLAALAFIFFNLGNAGVIFGTLYKKSARSLVDFGGGLLALSMILLLFLAHDAKMSWQHIIFYLLVLVILVSMPVGLKLSRRHQT